MKILITGPSLDETKNVSGISTVVRQIIERGNFDYKHFIAGRQDGEKQNSAWILKQFSSISQFRQTIKHEKIDIVHLNTSLTVLAILRDSLLAKIAKLAKKKLVVHLHGGKYLVAEFENKLLERLAEKMLRRADAVIVLSDLEAEIIEKRWQSLNLKILENAVSIENVPLPKRQNELPILLYLGRLHESKGLHEIVEAVKILREKGFDFELRAFGAGHLQDFFVTEMTAILGEHFYFGGVVAGLEKQKELAKADIFLLPSRYGEGLPMAMLEAMASENIVIVSKQASVEIVVREAFNGFLVEPRDVAELAEKLKYILENLGNLESVRKNARKTIVEKFALEKYIEKLEKIYAEI